MNTNITTNELKTMTDSEIILQAKKYPYPSNWINKDAFKWLEIHLSFLQGRCYTIYGNKNIFTTPIQ